MKSLFSRLFLALVALLLAAVGFACVGLSNHSLMKMNDWENRGTFSPRPGGYTVPIYLYPEHLREGPSQAILGAGAVAGVAGVVGAVNAVLPCGWRIAAFATMTSAVISTAVSIGVLAYVMVESGRNTDYAFSENDTQRGTYTIESWTCQVRHYAPAYWDRLSRLCHESEAVRWMTIPLVVFSALLFVAALLNMKRDKPSSSSKFELNKFRRDSGNLTNI